MIINQNSSSVTTIGDTEKHKVSIDPNNINFITTLLSTNLYSRPESSFLREIVSNAWDSHVEAHKEDKPVLIIYEGSKITIRDYGVGLSPERFDKIFLNIGSSTKRGDNTQIGGWGIGRFSALACSNTVEINSYYNGKLYKYLMIKDGNSVNIDLIMTLDTKEENGLEVSIVTNHEISRYDSSSTNPYIEGMRNLVFFPNIYIKSNNCTLEGINNCKIKRFKYFAVCSNSINGRLLLGNVLYPLDRSIVDKSIEDKILCSEWGNNVAIRFEIGELEVTPNREAILYSKDTIEKINKRIVESYNEACDIVLKELTKDFDNFLEYSKIFTTYTGYDFIGNTLSIDINYVNLDICNMVINQKNLGKPYPTYKGKDYSDKSNIIDSIYRSICRINLPNLVGLIAYNKFYKERIPYKYEHNCKIIGTKPLVIPKDAKFSYKVKNYLYDLYDSIAVVRETSKFDFIETVKRSFNYKGAFPDHKEIFDIIIEDIYNYVQNNSTTFDPATDTNFLKYKEDTKEDKSTKIDNELISVSIFKTYWYTDDYKNLEALRTAIKKEHKGIIVTNKRDDLLGVLTDIALIRGYLLLTVNLPYVKKLSDLPNIITREKAVSLKENRFLREMYTYIKKGFVTSTFSLVTGHNQYLNSFNIPYYEHIKTVRSNIDKASASIFNYLNYIENGPEDEYTKKSLDVMKNYSNLFKEFDEKANSIGINYYGTTNAAYTFFLVKSKKLRIPGEEYLRAKSIINKNLEL